MCNLKTVCITPLTVFDGWYCPTPDVDIHVDGLGHLASSAHIRKVRDAYYLLMAASVVREKVIARTLIPEDDLYGVSKEFETERIKLQAEPDDKTYYRIFLQKDESISKDFDILLDSEVEDPYHAEKYERVIYASLPKDLPLVLDSRGTLCVSPI